MRPSANSSLRVWRPPRRRPPTSITKLRAPLRMGARVRMGYGSATKTKQRQKKRFSGPVTHGDNASSSYSSMGNMKGYRMWKFLTKAKGVFNEENTVSYTVESYQGSQGIYCLDPLMDRADLSGIFASVDTGTRTSKCILGAGKSVFHIRNQTANLAKLRIYEIWTTRNPQDAKLNYPQGAWYDHYTDQQIPNFTAGKTGDSVSLNGAHKLDETPFHAKDFGRYYRVHKCTSVHLEAGQQHNHTIRHHFYRTVNREVWEDTPELMVSMGGITRHFMIVWYGGLTHDTLVAPAYEEPSGVKVDANEVTVSAIRLDISVRHQWTYAIDAIPYARFFVAGGLKGQIADEDYMGETGDADRDPTGA